MYGGAIAAAQQCLGFLVIAGILVTQGAILRSDISIHIKLPCLCVCVSSGFLKKVQTDFHETFHGS